MTQISKINLAQEITPPEPKNMGLLFVSICVHSWFKLI